MEILSSIYFLAVLCFIVALIYSSVGLGGGSSYTALMAIFGINTLVIPMVSLVLNIFVSSVGSFDYPMNVRASHPKRIASGWSETLILHFIMKEP